MPFMGVVVVEEGFLVVVVGRLVLVAVGVIGFFVDVLGSLQGLPSQSLHKDRKCHISMQGFFSRQCILWQMNRAEEVG